MALLADMLSREKVRLVKVYVLRNEMNVFIYSLIITYQQLL